MRCNSIFFNLKYSSYLYKSYIEDSHVEDNYCIILVLTLPLFLPFLPLQPFSLDTKEVTPSKSLGDESDKSDQSEESDSVRC